MRLDDSILLKSVISSINEDGDTLEEVSYNPLGKGKCKILPNVAATEVSGTDGKSYSTSYQVFLKKPSTIPVEGDVVRITKKDGSIDKDCEVKGFVTLKNWLKLWLV